jgi:hypothetical protein
LTGSEIIPLSESVKKTGHIRDFKSSVGYPFKEGTTTLKDNQGTIKTVKSSPLHKNTRRLATRISWLKKQYTMGIIRLMYTNTILQLSDCNTKPLSGLHLQSIISFIIGVQFYPTSNTQNYKSLYPDACRLFSDYLKHGKPTPITSPGPI